MTQRIEKSRLQKLPSFLRFKALATLYEKKSELLFSERKSISANRALLISNEYKTRVFDKLATYSPKKAVQYAIERKLMVSQERIQSQIDKSKNPMDALFIAISFGLESKELKQKAISSMSKTNYASEYCEYLDLLINFGFNSEAKELAESIAKKTLNWKSLVETNDFCNRYGISFPDSLVTIFEFDLSNSDSWLYSIKKSSEMLIENGLKDELKKLLKGKLNEIISFTTNSPTLHFCVVLAKKFDLADEEKNAAIKILEISKNSQSKSELADLAYAYSLFDYVTYYASEFLKESIETKRYGLCADIIKKYGDYLNSDSINAAFLAIYELVRCTENAKTEEEKLNFIIHTLYLCILSNSMMLDLSKKLASKVLEYYLKLDIPSNTAYHITEKYLPERLDEIKLHMMNLYLKDGNLESAINIAPESEKESLILLLSLISN